MERRVVITGIGALTPIGNNTAEFWDGLKNGKNGIAHITKFDTEAVQSKAVCAGELKNLTQQQLLKRKKLKDLICSVSMVWLLLMKQLRCQVLTLKALTSISLV